MLDDARLLSNHFEAHIMMTALKRGNGSWFHHPEVHVFYHRPEWLAWLHDFTVLEMARRGYPSGSDHKTPAEYPPASQAEFALNYESGFPGYKNTLGEWLARDYADLYAKWSKEGRFQADGYPLLGRRKRVKQVDGSVAHVPQPAKWELYPELKEKTHRDFLRTFDVLIGPRDQVPYDKEGLKKLANDRIT